MAVFHKWRPIEDLPDDWRSLTDGELDSLLLVWRDQRERLMADDGLAEFLNKVNREWAIETGVIEGAYTLDRGVTETLVLHGISEDRISRESSNLPPEMVAAILQDHLRTLDGLFSFVKGERQLSTSFVKELHASLLQHVDTYFARDSQGNLVERSLTKGDYKTQSNSVRREDGQLHEYTPPEHVSAEMDRLLEMAARQASESIPVEVRAAWLHHRFTQIHPFQDGNGRVARALASLVFLRIGWFPVTVHRDHRSRYFETLEKADAGDLRPLVQLLVEFQRNYLLKAVSTAIEARPSKTLDQVVRGIRDKLIASGKLAHPDWMRAIDIAKALTQAATEALQAAMGKLGSELTQLGKNVIGGTINYRVADETFDPAFLRQANLTVDPSVYQAGYAWKVASDDSFYLWINIVSLGPSFHGLAASVAGIKRGAVPELLALAPFIVNYREDKGVALSRYKSWLDQAIVQGLDAWAKTL